MDVEPPVNPSSGNPPSGKPSPQPFPLRKFAARQRAGRVLRWLLAIAGLVQVARFFRPSSPLGASSSATHERRGDAR